MGRVGDNRDLIKVCLRIRPLRRDEADVAPTIQTHDHRSIRFSSQDQSGLASVGEYTFSEVFEEETSQVQLFDSTTMPLVRDVLEGKNALLFAYGNTGSGKTYTIQGKPADQGILPRTLYTIFNSLRGVQAKKYSLVPNKRNGMDIQTEKKARQDRRAHFEEDEQYDTDEETDPCAECPMGSFNSEQISVDPDCKYTVFGSYVEIYNEHVYDLLEPIPVSAWGKTKLQSQRRDPKHLAGPDRSGSMFVRGVTEVEISNMTEALDLLRVGQLARQVASTDLNGASSRSHSVFTIRVVKAPLDARGEYLLDDARHPPQISQLSIVDLAGSERTGRTNNTGDRLRETGSINRSIHTLGQCIHTLRANQLTGRTDVVPFRDSQLTKMFKQYFEENGKVHMIVCVSPSQKDCDETAHVLKFSAITQQVTTTQTPSLNTPTGLTPGRGLASKLLREARKQLGRDEPAQFTASPRAERGQPPVCHLVTQDSDAVAQAAGLCREWQMFETSQQSLWIQQRELLREKERDFLCLLEDSEHTMQETIKENAQLKAALTDTQQHNCALQEELDDQHDLHKQQQLALQDLEVKNQDFVLLQQKVKDFSPQRRELQAHGAAVEAQLRAKEQEVDRLREDLHVYMEQSDNYLSRYEQERQQVQELQSTVEQLQQEKKTALAETAQQWRARMQEVEGNIGMMEEKVQTASTRKKNLESKFQRLKKFLQDPTAVLSPSTPQQDSPVARSTRSKRAAEEDPAQDEKKMTKKQRKAATQVAMTLSPLPASPQLDTFSRFDNPGKSLMINHVPVDMAPPPNTLMSPKLKNKKTVAQAQIKDLKRTDRYLLHSQENAGEHKLYKGEVDPSISKKGISVRFTGLEHLTAVGPLGGIHKRKADTEDGGDLPRKRRKSQEETGIEEEPERCMKAYTGNKHGLGMSVEHKAAAQGKK